MSNGTLVLEVKNSLGQRIENAFVLLNKRILNPCDSCFAYYDQGGLYNLKDSGFQNNMLPRVFVEIRHPDYLPFADSVFLFSPLIMRRPDQSYCYFGNKRPGIIKSNYSVVFLVDQTLEQILPIVELHGGTVLSSNNVCGDDKFSHGGGPLKLIVKHNSDLMAFAFQRNYKYAGPLFADGPHQEDGICLTKKIFISCYAGIEQANKIIELTRPYIQDGLIESTRVMENSWAINPQLEVIVNAEGIKNINDYIEQMQATGIIFSEMEIFMWQCPG